ncbi:hypothetical protein M1N82_02405, partial [Dehalococcoidia bacterium]|nr:hypothetical protein [Dehalococcoidia bacterium]
SPRSQLGLEALRARSNGLPFHVVGCFYGRDSHLGALWIRRASFIWWRCYLTPMSTWKGQGWGYRKNLWGIGDGPSAGNRFLSGVSPVGVRQLRAYPDLEWQRVKVRPVEQRALTYECTAMRVWTLTEDVCQERLFIHREKDGDYSYFFSNAPANTPSLRPWPCGVA